MSESVEQWLAALGMSEYAQCFAENRIDLSVLRDLTDADLKELGVVLGDRRKLLRAIAELDAPSPEAPRNTAERRQLTVMFCDLAGSTALSTRMDPEDLRTVIAAYHRSCAGLIESHGGFVAKYMGDGVLAYFGYPQAHEHDAERAVQAGLAIAEAVPQRVTAEGAPLAVRVGIATGLVVVGDLIGSGEARERSVVGETPNLAARLQGIAQPNMVVIAESTRRLTGNFFDLRDLGTQDLKGIAGPVSAWAVLRARSVESRFDALHAAETTALVGRQAEIALLQRRWSEAKAGHGHVLLLSGEAGIGKSRLTAALLEQLAAEQAERLRYFCSPQQSDSAFYPIRMQLARAAGLSRDDEPAAKLDKLDRLLARTSASPADTALFAELLSLPNDGRHPPSDLTPAQRRERTLAAFAGWIEASCQAAPTLLVVEDAHWIDPTSLEAFGRVIDKAPALRLLVVVTARPEFQSPWTERPHVTALVLRRLAQPDIEAMIERLAGDKPLPAALRRDILERTDGIPLFVEEMTKAVLEAGNDGARTAGTVPSPAAAVPASLHASLMARLDRLGPAKELAQIGAAIGREFSHALLAAVASKPQGELIASLERLISAGLLFRQGEPPQATYQFNHALVQEAAYGTLLRETRRPLHARIAETFESRFPDIVEDQPALLARHFTEAGLNDRAASRWAMAGRRSLSRSALAEAAEQLSSALRLMATLPGTTELRREQIKLQVELAQALMHTRGHAAAETQAAFDEARAMIEKAEALGEPPEDPLILFAVLYGFWVARRMTFKGDVARGLADQFLTLAHKRDETVPLMIGNLIMGISLLLSGDFVGGRTHLDRADALYDPAAHRSLAARFGHDVRVTVLSWRPYALWALGYPAVALSECTRAVADARDTSHAASLMFALAHTSLTLIRCGRYEAARAQVDELLVLAEEKRASWWKTYGVLLQGWIQALAGRPSEAMARIGEGIAAAKATGATAYAPWYLANLAQSSPGDAAWPLLREALAAVDLTREKWFEADIHRIAGEIAAAEPGPDAEAHFERALATAREQQARSLELRAAIDLARLWRTTQKDCQARDLLAPLYAGFTEGFDTRDLKEAKVLLDELASGR